MGYDEVNGVKWSTLEYLVNHAKILVLVLYDPNERA